MENSLPEDLPRWMRLAPMARYSSLSVMTLRRLVEAGKLHASRPASRVVLLDRLEVDRYLEECQKAGGADEQADPQPISASA